VLNIFCVGDVGIDTYPNEHKSYIGGCAYNVAFLLNELGSNKVTLIGTLGLDRWTGKLIEKIESHNIPFIPLKRTEDNLTLKITHTDGEKDFGHFEDKLLREFQWKTSEIEKLDSADLLIAPYFEEIRPMVDSIIDLHGDKIVLDLHEVKHISLERFNELASKVKILHFGNKFESDEFYIRTSKMSDVIISITLGSLGSELFINGVKYDCTPLVSENIVDTTGAGDAYLSRFIHGYSNGETIENLLEGSNQYGAMALTYFGATPGSQL